MWPMSGYLFVGGFFFVLGVLLLVAYWRNPELFKQSAKDNFNDMVQDMYDEFFGWSMATKKDIYDLNPEEFLQLLARWQDVDGMKNPDEIRVIWERYREGRSVRLNGGKRKRGEALQPRKRKNSEPTYRLGDDGELIPNDDTEDGYGYDDRPDASVDTSRR